MNEHITEEAVPSMAKAKTTIPKLNSLPHNEEFSKIVMKLGSIKPTYTIKPTMVKAIPTIEEPKPA